MSVPEIGNVTGVRYAKRRRNLLMSVYFAVAA